MSFFVQSEFFYVGTSMGATQFLTGMIERPELQQYIKEAFLMAPVAYMTLDVRFFLHLLLISLL